MLKILKIELNISRLNYLLELYKLSEQEFLKLISSGLKNEVKRNEIFSTVININNLKRIDKIFNKGLSFYLNPSPPPQGNNSSVFFRKKEFNSNLNLKAKQVINEFEDFELSISGLAALSDIDLKRKLPILSIKDNPVECAHKYRKIINPSFSKHQKEFLKSIINKLGSFNILVLEFVETWNQKEKANIDGAFLSPNVIVIKRQESISFRREIFTLVHEFAHYLLNIEEVENIDYDKQLKPALSNIEKWCNEFAFSFLIDHYESLFVNLTFSDESNDYHHDTIEEISNKTHLSKLALYTQLLLNKKISNSNYTKIKIEDANKAKEYLSELKAKRELEKEQGIEPKGSSPQPIKSELLISTVQSAFYEGVIDEYQFCKTLKISPEKIGNYIQ